MKSKGIITSPDHFQILYYRKHFLKTILGTNIFSNFLKNFEVKKLKLKKLRDVIVNFSSGKMKVFGYGLRQVGQKILIATHQKIF